MLYILTLPFPAIHLGAQCPQSPRTVHGQSASARPRGGVWQWQTTVQSQTSVSCSRDQCEGGGATMAAVRSFARLPFLVSARQFTAATTARYASSTPQDPARPKSEEGEAEWQQKGRINSKKSMKVELVGGKRYLWCACGYSKNQPFCDGTHLWSRFRLKIKQHPVFFKAPKDMNASMCLCKQTKKPPYCDGTHRRMEVQEAVIVEHP